MKYTAEAIRGKDLKPGDLFSTAGQEYWDLVPSMKTLGEKVYIRTEIPCPPDQEEVEIYRITIQFGES